MPGLTANDLIQALYLFIAGIGGATGALYLFRCAVAKIKGETEGDPYTLTFAIGLGWICSAVAHGRLSYIRMIATPSDISVLSSGPELLAVAAGAGVSLACLIHLWIAVKLRVTTTQLAVAVMGWAAICLVIGTWF